jgi:wyosine [tRNA(Phe)-imidazoG37] synthetase (radical SAM superfamily)
VEAASDDKERDSMSGESVYNPPDSSVYGPVFSWRFGNSLGIDLLLCNSICSFRCPYCQLGRINVATVERRTYVATDKVIADLRAADWRDADVITISGNGEPTLALNLGEVITAVRKATKKPIVVLTNGSLLSDPTVRKELALADHVSCKLDASNDEMLEALNRPATELTVESLVASIARFRSEFKGSLSLQTMMLPVNSRKSAEFVPLYKSIKPDEIHLNLPSRAFPEYWRPELRGDHKEFSNDRAFRMVQFDDVETFRAAVEKGTKAKVRIPPAP